MCKIADWFILAVLGICSVSDWKKKTISVLWLVLLGVAVICFTVICNPVDSRLRLSGALIGVLFLIISKCTKEAIGYGDSWLILFLEIYMGCVRGTTVLFVAALLSGVVSLFFLWKKRWKKTETLPFVPFLCVSYLGAMVL